MNPCRSTFEVPFSFFMTYDFNRFLNLVYFGLDTSSRADLAIYEG